MKSNIGLTLVELIIAITLLGLVTLSAVAINVSATRFLASENIQARLTRQAGYGLERIAKDILLSFGDPVNPVFQIGASPGLDEGNILYLHRRDTAPEWVAYDLDTDNYLIRFNDDCSSAGSCAPAKWITLVENVVDPDPNYIFQAIDSNADTNALNDNLIRVGITCRQDPTQEASPTTNPEVTLVSAVHIRGVASQ